MGFDSRFLTPSAVDLTLLRLRNSDGSHAEQLRADCSAVRLSDSIVDKQTKMQLCSILR